MHSLKPKVLNCHWLLKNFKTHSSYDHISKIINKLLTEKPKNAYDVFESFSEKVKKETFQPKSTLLDDYVTTEEFNLARLQKPLFEKIGDMEADMVRKSSVVLKIFVSVFIWNNSFLLNSQCKVLVSS